MGFSEEWRRSSQKWARSDCGLWQVIITGGLRGGRDLRGVYPAQSQAAHSLALGNPTRLHCEYLPMSNAEQESVLLKAPFPASTASINEAEIMRALDCLGFAEEEGDRSG